MKTKLSTAENAFPLKHHHALQNNQYTKYLTKICQINSIQISEILSSSQVSPLIHTHHKFTKKGEKAKEKKTPGKKCTDMHL